MRKNYKKIIILGLGILLLSCTTAPLTGRRQVKLVDDEAVTSAGISEYNQIVNAYKSKGLLANNTTNGKRLQTIGRQVSTAVENYMRNNNMTANIKNLNWEYNLITESTPNAYAMPGGKILFTTGIMPILQNDAGIAFVMGHEIGHVIAGHSSERVSQGALAGIASSIVGLVTGNNAASTLVDTGLSVSMLKFSRTQEYEADKYGMIFMAMAGYNPSEAIKVEERMEATGSSGKGDFLSSHPSGQNRIEAMKKFLPEAMKYYKK